MSPQLVNQMYQAALRQQIAQQQVKAIEQLELPKAA